MKALLLLAFGGPRSLEEVELFLTRLFRDRRPSPEQVGRIKERYRLIGGSSPLPEITRAQARSLEEKLNQKGYSFKSYVGMRYGHPLIEETLGEILRDGFRGVVAIPMAPFRSGASTGAYVEEVDRVLQTMDKGLEVSFVEGWSSAPLFIDAVKERIEEGLVEFPPEAGKAVHLVFTAHSLPKTVVEGTPYVKDMEESVRRVLERVGPLPWHVAFQSKGGGPGEWIGPDVESILTDLSGKEIRGVLIVPIGFVSDHIEILYDIDIAFRKKAESLGIVLKRTRSLNTSERFIEALAGAVESHLRGQER
jgi:ferrochelatase